jgi:crotonobetainyl-CoA:carnitine CoA-transferase CaiB-like acyl-CoA transferase
VQHAVLGAHTCEELGYHLDATPGAIEQPGPLLGEHSASVYREMLGLSEVEIDSLATDGVLH